MTGGYIRVERNGSFENIELEFCTEEERLKFLNSQPFEVVVRWVTFLSDCLVKNEQKNMKEKENIVYNLTALYQMKLKEYGINEPLFELGEVGKND